MKTHVFVFFSRRFQPQEYQTNDDLLLHEYQLRRYVRLQGQWEGHHRFGAWDFDRHQKDSQGLGHWSKMI